MLKSVLYAHQVLKFLPMKYTGDVMTMLDYVLGSKSSRGSSECSICDTGECYIKFLSNTCVFIACV
jgi:hypothetical protein